MKSILVLGAGELGQPMLEHLARHPVTRSGGVRISALIRPETLSSPSPSRSQTLDHLRSLSITLVPGDIASSTETELTALFRPYDIIISCTGFGAATTAESFIQLKIARCVLAAGVRRYYPWQFGLDYDVIGRGSTQPLFDEQLDVRDLSRKNQDTTQWVIVSTGVFTSFLFEPFWGVLDQEKGVVRAFGSWDNRVTATAPEDIARCMAEIVLVDYENVRDEVVYLAGDTVSYARLAEFVEGVLGRNLQREVWTLERLKEDLKADPGNQIKRYRPIWAEGRGVAWSVEESYNGKNGIKMIGVEDWARKVLKG